ncbi:hypothetical protein EAO72_14550 [Streptomyces sp. or43]|nr:hypothetical protein EAO72_14550 [Streptomyces sp. or43]
MAERLGSRKDRHRGLLFVRLERERKGGVRKDYFTVRDRTDTDQGRHRPGPGPPGPCRAGGGAVACLKVCRTAHRRHPS